MWDELLPLAEKKSPEVPATPEVKKTLPQMFQNLSTMKLRRSWFLSANFLV